MRRGESVRSTGKIGRPQVRVSKVALGDFAHAKEQRNTPSAHPTRKACRNSMLACLCHAKPKPAAPRTSQNPPRKEQASAGSFRSAPSPESQKKHTGRVIAQ